MNTIIEGSNLMVFVEGKSIALATNHTLSISGETSDTSNKDLGGGVWGAEKVRRLSWSCTSENLFSMVDYNKLFGYMASRTLLEIVFSPKGEESGHDIDEFNITTWTDSDGLKGKAYITSLTANAPDGDNATFSVEFTGYGALSPYESQNAPAVLPTTGTVIPADPADPT